MLFDLAIEAQSNYETDQDGSWSSSSTWLSNNKPPDPLVAGDSIFVKHDITYDVNQKILGVMVVEAGASITSTNKDLDIGKGGTDAGELINYGTVDIRDLEVKPDNGCTATIVLPTINNYGTITLSNKLHIGNNCGAGSFYNYAGGTVTVDNEIHLDNYMFNADTMYVLNKLKNHGGIIDGCGYIETPELDIDQNTSRPGEFNCINICTSDGSDPIIDIDGDDYDDLQDAVDNASSAEFVADPDSTLICDYNYVGNFMFLPIELIAFDAFLLDNGSVEITWQTLTESDNDFFTVEKSVSLDHWEMVGIVDGAGDSFKPRQYSTTDQTPFHPVSYYRLKQTDFGGSSTHSEVLTVNIDRYSPVITIYPNPSASTLFVSSTPTELDNIHFFDVSGRDITSMFIVERTSDSTLSVDMSRLNPGSYSLRSSTQSIRFMKSMGK